MTEAIQKLIADNRWNPNMDEAPKDGEDVVLLIPGSTTPITIGHCLDGDWFPQDETTLDGNMFIPEPTHFRAMPDDRLAEVCKIQYEVLSVRVSGFEHAIGVLSAVLAEGGITGEKQAVLDGLLRRLKRYETTCKEALSRADKIAGGGECT